MNQPDRTDCFCKRIREVRRIKNYSSEWVAQKVGIPYEKYMNIESGLIEYLDFETAMSIAFVLDVNMNYLCGFTDELLPNNLSTILNEFDFNIESERITRALIHEILLMDDTEREDLKKKLQQIEPSNNKSHQFILDDL